MGWNKMDQNEMEHNGIEQNSHSILFLHNWRGERKTKVNNEIR